VRHRNSRYLNNQPEQDHRSLKGRYGPMRGFKRRNPAGRFCGAYDELRNFLRPRSHASQIVSADYRKFHFLRRPATVLSALQAARKALPFIRIVILAGALLSPPATFAGVLVDRFKAT
jgi:hypothetical protein